MSGFHDFNGIDTPGKVVAANLLWTGRFDDMKARDLVALCDRIAGQVLEFAESLPKAKPQAHPESHLEESD